MGIVTAVTNIQVTLNVISEFVGGFIVPGNALVMNMFKAYGCMTLLHAMAFSQQLKLGHYMKIPSRAMFRAQLIATFVSVILVSLE